MFRNTRAFSSFSVNDLARAKDFYGKVLGLDIEDREHYLDVTLEDGARIMVYSKPNHQPASFTVLNFSVSNLEKTMQELGAAGVKFEHYDLPDLKTDKKGIFRAEGIAQAWFQDPAGNIFSILEERA
jgi:catechol 2,3-dioxygenase-like lactoylglutathione lyase family enzyme